jgi:hypothetical protein
VYDNGCTVNSMLYDAKKSAEIICVARKMQKQLESIFLHEGSPGPEQIKLNWKGQSSLMNSKDVMTYASPLSPLKVNVVFADSAFFRQIQNIEADIAVGFLLLQTASMPAI